MSESKVHKRCNQCDVKLAGRKAAESHGATTGHQWQPWLGYLACHKAFTTRNVYKAHTSRCAGRATIPVLNGVVELSFRSAECDDTWPPLNRDATIRAKRSPAKYACARCQSEFPNVVDLVVHTTLPCKRQTGSTTDVAADCNAVADGSPFGLLASTSRGVGIPDKNVPAVERHSVPSQDSTTTSTDHLVSGAGMPNQTFLKACRLLASWTRVRLCSQCLGTSPRLYRKPIIIIMTLVVRHARFRWTRFRWRE
ncbi:hypothetical protein BV20DRAFT_383268 [Pilatotrama ljubarskyi]|nr:hypothetical protein BV20DRAFT_383268 [Pilatotrama ljubarskyi]